MTSTIIDYPMAWTNERLKLSCTDNIGLKQLWKMIIFDNNNNNNNNTDNNNNNDNNDNSNDINRNSNIINNNNNNNNNKNDNNNNNCNKSTSKNNTLVHGDNLTQYITAKEIPSNMSLLKFLAINALELSAPASPLLLQQTNTIPQGWLQLSGHPRSIAPAANGIVRKRISGLTDSEAIAYRGINIDINASQLVPEFIGVSEINGETYLELQDLLNGYKDPAVMDIKLGCRTFLESEVKNSALRPDLYEKMISVDSTAPTAEEHELKAITKLRYMLFRERMSSSELKGFRIEALKMHGAHEPITDLKTVRNDAEVLTTMQNFLAGKRDVTKKLLKRLKVMRNLIEKSEFFKKHEIVGSSIFIVYDNENCGAWLIDFAKTRRIPDGIKIDHRKTWHPGNCEEGLLHGIDELINVFDEIYRRQLKCDSRKLNNRR